MSQIVRPKPRRVTLPLERLLFDTAFQVRGEPFNEEHVRRLVEAHEDGERFEPLEVAEVARPGRSAADPWLYVIDGFNRGEAYRRRGVSGVECLVFAGTREDAELWALSSNARHGMQRTPDDCRRAFDRLVSNPLLLARVIEAGKRAGGTGRAIAKACGISHGAVNVYVQAAGLRVDRITGKIIKADEESPEVTARRELAAELKDQGKTTAEIARDLGISPATVKTSMNPSPPARAGKGSAEKPAREPKVEVRSAEDPVLAGAEASLAEFKKAIRTAGKCVEDLLRSRYAPAMRAALKAAGFPTEVTEREEMAPIGEKGPPKTVRVETWTVPAALAAAASSVEARLYAGQAEL
ncbi:hypothetical protein [Gemmata sp.]|uniref:hypothetical protein n=1 Tax=Gemmata sp. TaxID=1914242 RepID=UPI003F7093C9